MPIGLGILLGLLPAVLCWQRTPDSQQLNTLVSSRLGDADLLKPAVPQSASVGVVTK